MSTRATVANVLIQPRAFDRVMSETDMQTVEELIAQFHARMRGEHLVCAAQALGILTADYCQQITERGGESIYALQDIAGRGSDWIAAGDAASAVVQKAQRRQGRRGKVR